MLCGYDSGDDDNDDVDDDDVLLFDECQVASSNGSSDSNTIVLNTEWNRNEMSIDSAYEHPNKQNVF